jgi:hypothetical protein
MRNKKELLKLMEKSRYLLNKNCYYIKLAKINSIYKIYDQISWNMITIPQLRDEKKCD